MSSIKIPLMSEFGVRWICANLMQDSSTKGNEMYSPIHSINALFEQLGLESSDQAIETFIAEHSPLPAQVKLYEADFWNKSQRTFIQQMKDEDADWAEIVDQLDAMLR